jgi:hypothetical protein
VMHVLKLHLKALGKRGVAQGGVISPELITWTFCTKAVEYSTAPR